MPRCGLASLVGIPSSLQAFHHVSERSSWRHVGQGRPELILSACQRSTRHQLHGRTSGHPKASVTGEAAMDSSAMTARSMVCLANGQD